MVHRLATPQGRGAYALRKHTPEPVFGVIKSAMGFRQFHLRGLQNVKASGTLKREAAVRPRLRLTETPASAPSRKTPIP